MMQVPIVQGSSQPSLNAVKININNPQVNTGYNQNPIQSPVQNPGYTAPIYDYPKAQIYEMPQQSIYKSEAPSLPSPVVIPPAVTKTVSAANTDAVATPVAAAAPEPTQPQPVDAVQDKAPTATNDAPAQNVEVKSPETTEPGLDVNEFIGKLTDPDYDKQAKALEAIADLTQTSPEQAKSLLDTKVIDTLLGIMNKDTSSLAGPTPEQLQIREKIMNGQKVSDAETTEANKISPMEQAERNKQYSIYTVALLQKLYGSEIEKMSNSVVPFAELPGIDAVVKQVKDNTNPLVKASGIDALSYIQRPEYKADLTEIFSAAAKDKDANVQQAATKALEKLNNANAASQPAPEQAKQTATEDVKTDSKPAPENVEKKA